MVLLDQSMAKRKRRTKISRKKLKIIHRKKKLHRTLLQVALLSTGLVAGILARPSIISDPQQRSQVEEVRNQVLQANDNIQEKALETFDEGSGTVKGVIDKASDITEDFSGTNPQEVVQQKVEAFSQEVKALPEKQIKKIKLEFCQDVIEEIELTCSQE